MADEERGNKQQKKQTTKSKGRSKSRWRKPDILLKIGNKEKGHAFVEKRKKIAVREYKKLLKNTREEHRLHESSGNKAKPTLNHSGRFSNETSHEQDKLNSQTGSDSCIEENRKRSHQWKQKPVNRFTAAESAFKKRKQEKEQQIKEREEMIQKHREEVREKMKKRREAFGRLNRRTRKGQPVMANQIEHLLGKIQSQT